MDNEVFGLSSTRGTLIPADTHQWLLFISFVVVVIIIFQCYEYHQQNTIQYNCIVVEAEISKKIFQNPDK